MPLTRFSGELDKNKGVSGTPAVLGPAAAMPRLYAPQQAAAAAMAAAQGRAAAAMAGGGVEGVAGLPGAWGVDPVQLQGLMHGGKGVVTERSMPILQPFMVSGRRELKEHSHLTICYSKFCNTFALHRTTG